MLNNTTPSPKFTRSFRKPRKPSPYSNEVHGGKADDATDTDFDFDSPGDTYFDYDEQVVDDFDVPDGDEQAVDEFDKSVNTIIHGDCREVLRRFPSGKIPLLTTDPPWNLNLQYDGKLRDDLSREEYLSVHREWMADVPRILTANGSFFLIVGGPYVHHMAVMGEELGLHLRRTIVLHNTFGQNQCKNFTPSHSFVFYFVKDPKQFVFNADAKAIRVPSARQLVYKDKRANPKGRLPDDVWILRPQDAPPPLFSPAGDVWFAPKVCGTFKDRVEGHPCQMPLPVMERIIAVASKPGDLVVDPFSGTGPTCVAAIQAGRKFIGIEQSLNYVELSRQRIAQEGTKKS